MSELVFFDAACQVGKNSVNAGLDVPELLQEMNRSGVAKALVRDGNLGGAGAVACNPELVRMLREGDPDHRLYGVWCLLPEQTGELLPPAKFFDAMEENGIHALTLRPIDHRWNPCRLTIKNYMAEALARRIPVLLDGFRFEWDRIQAFVEQFPENIFISVENSGKWGMDRRFRPIMDTFPNFYLSMDGYWVPEGINELVRRYGAERILFGSRCPNFYAGSAMLQLKQLGLSAEDTAKIASGNLEKLLKGASK